MGEVGAELGRGIDLLIIVGDNHFAADCADADITLIGLLLGSNRS